MGFYTGCTGSLVYLGKPVAKVRDWSLETSLNMLETTVLGDCTNTYQPGVKNSTGSATLMYYRLESGESTTFTEFTALLAKIQKVGSVTAADRVQLTLRVGPNSNDDIVFNAYITSAQVSISTNELVTVPIQFTIDGDFVAGGTISAA
jgi:hypothetical protein